jgi:hypothetical protein
VSIALRVPYITAYDGEDVTYRLVLEPHRGATDGLRLSYADALEQDWLFGVLWHRHGMTRAGAPQWKMVNTVRQRRCMLHLLCQVCGEPATGEDSRIWWVMAEPPGRVSGELRFTHTPPCCRSCIPLARALCPRLRRESHVYTASGAEPYGVVAGLYRPAAGRNVVVVQDAVELPLEAFRDLEYALATQLIVQLDGLQGVDPGEWHAMPA